MNRLFLAKDTDFWVIGHKGASSYEPENTLRSFRTAIQMGVTGIEIDLRGTLDGEIVVIHDENISSTTNKEGNIGDFTLEEIKAFDAGKGEKIPTLQEVIQAVRGKVFLNLEIKEEGLEQSILNVLKLENFEDVLISSFSVTVLEILKDLSPELPRGLLYNTLETSSAFSFCMLIECASIHPFHTIIDQNFVEESHRHGFKVVAWTVNQVSRMEELIQIGVDGIISDSPDILVKVLRDLNFIRSMNDFQSKVI